jgi:hypothetical protein
MNDVAKRCYRKFEQYSAIARLIEDHGISDEGWSIVIRFYAALHLVNAYLVEKTNVALNLDATAHEHRKKAMRNCPELRDAPKKYRELKDLSELVRYSPTYNFVPADAEESIALFTKIVAIVDPKIKKT